MKHIIILVVFFAISNSNAQSPLDTEIEGQITINNIPSIAVGVIKNKQLCWSNGYGFSNIDDQKMATDSTVYTLASITKVVTATAAFHLMETGAFQLDDNINDYLPYDIVNPNFPNDSISFRMLLQHTSSLSDNFLIYLNYSNGDHPDSLEDFVYNYLNPNGMYYSPTINFSNNVPGSNFEYCNTAVALLGYLVEVISGQDFSLYCTTNIFTPLEMHATNFFLSEIDTSNLAMPYKWNNATQNYDAYGHYGYSDYPDGLLRSTIKDFSNFLIMYLNNGSFKGNQILTPASIELLTPINSTEGHTWFRLDGAMPNNQPAWGHGGEDRGTSTFTIFENGRNGAVILLTNGEYTNYTQLSFWPTLWDMAYGNEVCEQATSVEPEPFLSKQIRIFPNPTYGETIIQGSNINEIEVYDMNSKLINRLHNAKNDTNIQLDLSKFSNGFFLLKVIYLDKTMTFHKIIKTQH